MSRRVLRLALGLLFAALFSWLIFRTVDLDAILRVFADAGLTWIAAGLASFMLGFACRIERWRQLLTHDNPRLRWRDCAGPFLGSFAVNNLLPFRAGDAMRAFAFNARLGTAPGAVVVTLLVERVLDLLSLLLLLAVVLLFFGADSSRLIGSGVVVLAMGALALLLALFRPQLFLSFVRQGVSALGKVAPGAANRLLAEIEKAVRTMHSLARTDVLLRLLGWSLLSWLAEGGLFWCAALSLPSITYPAGAWLALPAGTLATLIPSTPGYVGTFDYFAMLSLTETGNPPVAAAAYALLVHALLWLPPTLLGGLYLMATSTRPLQTDENP